MRFDYVRLARKLEWQPLVIVGGRIAAHVELPPSGQHNVLLFQDLVQVHQ